MDSRLLFDSRESMLEVISTVDIPAETNNDKTIPLPDGWYVFSVLQKDPDGFWVDRTPLSVAKNQVLYIPMWGYPCVVRFYGKS